MPMEWLHILLHNKVYDKASTFEKLKYDWTVDDVHDFLEVLSVQDYYQHEENERMKDQGRNNANR